MDFDFNLGGIADSVGRFFEDYGAPIGIGAQAVGTMLRRNAIAKIEREQAAMREAERAKQRALQEQIAARTAQATQAAGHAQSEADRQALAAKYEAFMAPVAGAKDFGEYTASNDGAPQEIKDRAARTLATSIQKGKDYTRGLAELTSYGGNQQALARTMGDAARDVGSLQRASVASTAALPYRFEDANRNARGGLMASDIADQLGQASFLYGVSGKRRASPPKLSGGASGPRPVAMGTI